uniref:Uncharacterized protein n=1 Tax=Romanomermis culicivorax TaxID=13658 RepID=A0A915JA24_ROMCU
MSLVVSGDAYLSDNLHGSDLQTFDQQFEEFFNKQSHVDRFGTNFFVSFLLGFHDALLTDSIRSQYGIEHIFHGWYLDFRLAKFFILTNKGGKKKIIIRNFYLSGRADDELLPPKYKSQNGPILLTENEKEMMERILARWNKLRKLHSQARGELSRMSFEEFQRKHISELDATERNRLLTQTVDADNPKMLDEYEFVAKEFTLQEVEYRGTERGKSCIDLTEIFSLPPFTGTE